MIAVLILDERSQTRDTLATLLSWQPERFEVAATCAHVEEARSLLTQGLSFDVVLIDPTHPVTRAALSELAHLVSERPLVGFARDWDEATLLRFARAGGRSYVLHAEGPARLLEALDTSATGGAVVSPAIASRLLTWVTRPHSIPRHPTSEPLTQREIEVLTLLTEGQTYSQVARALGIGVGTVQSHVKNIYRKLDVTSKTEAATRALQEGLLPASTPSGEP